MKILRQLLVSFSVLLLCVNVFAKKSDLLGTFSIRELPCEAQQTLVLIKKGGPFPYVKDGVVFGNYEGVLPKQKRGYYLEFTVKTLGARNRGARRIIVCGELVALCVFFFL